MIKSNLKIFRQLLIEKDYSFLFLIFSVFLLPLSINFSTFTFILSLILKIIQIAIFRQKMFATTALKNSALIGFFFFLYLILNSWVQTSFHYTFGLFEKQFSHWLLLFLVPLILKEKKSNEILIKVFFAGVLSAIVFVFIMCFVKQIYFDRNAFENLLDIHHTYLSVYLLFLVNVIFLRDLVINKGKNIKHTVFSLLILTLSFFTIFYLNSKISTVIFCVLLLVHIFPQLSKKNALNFLLGFVIITILLFLFNQKLSVSYSNALDFRLKIWEVSTRIIESNPIFGNLKASEKDLINYEHYKNGAYYFFDSDLNSHNQYLSILLKYGLVGLVLLSSLLVHIVKKMSSRSPKISIREFIGFFIIISFVFYIENFLDRHHGIMFFAIFFNYYLVAIENKHE